MQLRKLATTVTWLTLITVLSGQEIYRLENMLNSFKEKSYDRKIWELERKKVEIERVGNDEDMNNKVTATMKTENVVLGDYDEYTENNFKSNLITTVSYKDFYLEGVFEKSNQTGYFYEDNVLKKHGKFYNPEKISLGYKKSINDFFYSENDYRKKSIELKGKKLELEIERVIYEEIIKLIDSYVEIKDLEGEIAVKESLKKENEQQLKSSKEKFQMGEATELEVEFLELENEKTGEEIEYLKESMKTKITAFMEKTGAEKRSNVKFADIENIDFDIVEKRFQLNVNEAEIEEEIENRKYIRRKNQPEVILDTKYDMMNEEAVLLLEVKSDFFSYNSEDKIKSRELEKKEIEKLKIKQEEKQEVIQLAVEKEHLKESFKIYKKMNEANKKKFVFTQKMFLKGYVDYSEYIKVLNELKQSEVDLIKSKNKLSGFNYKMKYRVN